MQTSARQADPDRRGPPRDLAELLHELLAAYQRHTIYPAGHPLLEPAVDGVARALDLGWLDRESLAIGVTPGALIVAGFDAGASALVRECADRWYRRNIGGIRFQPGADRAEVAGLLAALTRHADPLPAASAGAERLPPVAYRSAHIEVVPLHFEHLGLLYDTADDTGAARLGAPWADRVWAELVRATVGTGTAVAVPADADPETLARLIASDDPVAAGRVLDALAGLARAVRERGQADALLLQRQLVRLVRAITPEVLEQLVRSGADAERRRAFLQEVTPALTTEVVLALLRAAARAEGRQLSPALLQLLEKLAAHADHGGDESRPRADDAFRRRIRELVGRWGLDGDVPPAEPDYAAALGRIPRRAPDRRDPVRTYAADAERVVQLSVELGVLEAPTLRAADRLVIDGRIGVLLDLLDAAADEDPVAAALRSRVCRESTVRLLLGGDPIDLEALARVAPATGAPAADSILDALASQKDRRVRARLLDILGALGDDAGPAAAARLDGAPWYVQRNLLRVLGRIDHLPPGFDPAPYARHDDARVRHEALKLMLADPARREAAIVQALDAPDLRSVRLGLLAASEGCPDAAAPLILRRLSAESLDGELQALAIRAVAPVKLPEVLDALLGVCLVRGPFFIGRRLAPRSPAVLAAVAALATHWRYEPRAERALALARRVRDTDLRDAAAPRDADAAPARRPVVLVPR